MRDILGCLGTLIHENPLDDRSNGMRLRLTADDGLVSFASNRRLGPFLDPLLQQTNRLANQLTRTIDTPRLHKEVKPVCISLGIDTESTLNMEVVKLTSFDILVGFRHIRQILLLHGTCPFLIDMEPLGHRTYLRLSGRLCTESCRQVNGLLGLKAKE